MHPVFFFPGVAVTRGITKDRQVFWLPDLSTSSNLPTSLGEAVVISRFRPRSQRRDRAGL